MKKDGCRVMVGLIFVLQPSDCGTKVIVFQALGESCKSQYVKSFLKTEKWASSHCPADLNVICLQGLVCVCSPGLDSARFFLREIAFYCLL